MPSLVVLAYGGFGDGAIEQGVLQSIAADVRLVRDTQTPESRAAIADADAIIVTTQQVSAELVASMKRCRIISRAGTGLDSIDIPAATEHGVWVAYVPDYSVDEVSSHAIALLLAHARGIPQLVESTRAGAWTHQPIVPRRRLHGQTLGLLGFGRIGQLVAVKARALGLEIIVYDPHISAEQIAATGATPVAWEQLLRTADYLTLHVPLTDETRQIIDAAALAHMKPTAVLINTARGGLVDEQALLHAVRSGQIGGAALDVLAVEPPSPDHALLHEPNVLVTPHSGWYSEDALHDVRVRAADEVVRVLCGERPRFPVNEIARE